MQDLIDNLKEVIGAPFLVVPHHVFKDSIHFLNDVHLHQLNELNFSGLDDSPDDLDCESVELLVVDLEVLEDNFNQLQLV